MIDESTADRIRSAVSANESTIDRLWDLVQRTPELAHEEHVCSTALCDTLSAAGFAIERPVAGMETAFRATLDGARRGPTVGVVVVFDAVPGLDADGNPAPMHACGHGPISAGVVGAALAIADLAADLPGRLMIVGCPADEIHAPGTVQRGGGKALTAEAGVWNDVDVALYVHPEFIDTVSRESQWMRRERLVVTGDRSLRDDVDQAPLDALTRLLGAVQSRPAANVMLESAHLDGDVEGAVRCG